MNAIEEVLRDFETGRLDPAGFRHRDHVRLGYELLSRYSLGDAISRFSNGLRLLAARAGRPQLYHETITVAFLALINERRAAGTAANWPEFESENPDLLDKRCLERWYGAEQLRSDLARRAFCLPSRNGDLKSPTERQRRFQIAAP